MDLEYDMKFIESLRQEHRENGTLDTNDIAFLFMTLDSVYKAYQQAEQKYNNALITEEVSP